MHTQRLPRIRSIQAMLDKMESACINLPLEKLRPPVPFQNLKSILKTWLLQLWHTEPLTPDPWDVIARIYYHNRPLEILRGFHAIPPFGYAVVGIGLAVGFCLVAVGLHV